MKKKIIITLVIISLIFLAGGIYIVSSIEKSTSTLDYLIKLHQIEILREHLLLQLKKVQSDLVLWETQHARGLEIVISNVRKMDTLTAACFDCHHSPAVVKRLEIMLEEIDEYKNAFSRSVTFRSNRAKVAEEADKAFHISESLMSELNKMVHMAANKLSDRTQSSLRDIARTKMLVFLLLAITPFFAAGLGFIIIKELTRPVRILMTATKKLREGDLDFRIEGLQDEYGEVAKSFNAMSASLKQHMHEVRESEKRYRVLFESAGDAIFLVEAEGENIGDIVEVNQAAAQMHGYTVDELLGLNLIKDLDAPDAGAGATERVQRIMSGEWIKEELNHIRKDGSVFPVEITAGLLEFMGHKYILGIDRDISKRKKMENQILYAKIDWEETFNTITDMITIHDRDFNIVRANKAAIDTLGLSSLNDESVKCFKIFHGQSHPPEGCPSCECYNTGQPASFEIYEPHLNMFLEVRAMPRMVDDQITGLIHVIRDITERKRVEEAMQRAEQMKLVGEWAAGLAHEIKNPLAAIKVSVEVLLEELDISAEDRAIVLRAVDEIKRIETLLKSLLNFAKPPRLQLTSVNVNEFLDQTLAFSLKHPSLSTNSPVKIEVKKDLDENVPLLKADPVQLQQVFLNLLLNAIEAMPDGGTIGAQSTYNPESKAIQIEISDTGKGMDNEVLDKAFKPFFTTKSKGSGLGLAISRRIIEQHDGTISVTSEPGVKTVFKILLHMQEQTRKTEHEK